MNMWVRLFVSAAASGALVGMFTTAENAPTSKRLENFVIGALVGVTNLATKLKPTKEELDNARF